jgi:hypothetical protein
VLTLKVLTIILVGIIILAALAGNIMSIVEQPDYKLIKSKENIEVRDYPPMIVAEVKVSGERKEAIREGFKLLADYNFGNNTSHKKMDMTAPVTSELSEKLSMTAPVTQEQEMGKWKVKFVMPKKYRLETLPKPKFENVVLLQIPAKCFAVIRFSGLVDDESIKLHTEQLKAYILAEKLKPIGGTVLAFYNPPWTLPFLRRNEIMIEVDPAIDSKSIESHL